MALVPIAVADLGASLDALPAAAGVTGKHVGMSPPLLVAAIIVSTAAVDLRLYRYDSELLRWIPSATAAATYGTGVHELQWITAAVKGLYALVQTGGAGTVSYVFRPGTN